MGFGFLPCVKQFAKEISDIDMLRPDGKVTGAERALAIKVVSAQFPINPGNNTQR